MSDKVALTSSMRSNLLSLKNTQSMFDKTQDRLSTGYKVNSAMDNPSSYFTAQSLNSRADDLSGLLDSIGQAISTLQTADKGITSLQDFVEQAKSVANSARDTANVASSVKSSVAFTNAEGVLDESAKLTDIITGAEAGDTFNIRLGDSTKIEGTRNMTADQKLSDIGLTADQSMEVVIDGTAHAFTFAAGDGKTATAFGVDNTVQDLMDTMTEVLGRKSVSVSLNEGKLSISTLDNTSVVVRSAAQTEDHTTLELKGTVATATDAKVTAADGIAVSFATTVGQTLADVVETINAEAATAGSNVVAKMNSTNDGILVYDKAVGETAAVAFTAGASGLTGATAVATEDQTVAVDIPGTSANDIFGFDKGTDIAITADMTLDDFRKALVAVDGVTADYDAKGYLTVKGQQGDDLTITDKTGDLAELLGINGAATNGNNERATYAKQFDNILTQIDELVQDTSYKGINLLNGDDLTVVFNESRTSTLELKGVTFNAQGLGFTASENEWIDNESIDTALNQISKATSMLRAQASEFGQNLSTVQIREDFTENMINNLQTGADKLTLADMNEESANLLALQTRQQLATNSLSMANQAAQSVLKLF